MSIDEKNPKIAILSLTIGERYKNVTKYGRLSKIEYCKKHGYDFIEDESIYDNSRPIPWSKILLIKKYLTQYDYVVWIDGDTIILNLELTLEKFITDTMPLNIDFLMCRDHNFCNTGVWFLRNTKYVLDIMDEIYKQTDYIYRGEWEQTAFNKLYNDNYNDLQSKCNALPFYECRAFNCTIYQYKIGDFLVHLMGLDIIQMLMNEHYPLQKEDEPDWAYNNRMEWLKKKYSE